MIMRIPIAAGILVVTILSGCTAQNTDEVPSSPPPSEAPEADADAGRIPPDQLPDALLQGEFEQLYSQFSEEFQNQISLQDFQALGGDFHQSIDRYLPASKLILPGAERHVWTDEAEKHGLMAVVDSNDEILGLQMIMLQKFPETDEVYTETEFQLPFKGEWYTFWGGTNELINYHYAHPSQRYAIDWIITKNGQSYEGDPSLNESYYAFGEEVLAPAAGTVIAVENSIADNPVGQMNPSQPEGNYVMIDHGNGEYSLLAHFQQHSIQVNLGDKVETGDVLGNCGNSGNSSEPHIHYHVVDSSGGADANSIRIQFKDSPEILQGTTVKAEG